MFNLGLGNYQKGKLLTNPSLFFTAGLFQELPDPGALNLPGAIHPFKNMMKCLYLFTENTHVHKHTHVLHMIPGYTQDAEFTHWSQVYGASRAEVSKLSLQRGQRVNIFGFLGHIQFVINYHSTLLL